MHVTVMTTVVSQQVLFERKLCFSGCDYHRSSQGRDTNRRKNAIHRDEGLARVSWSVGTNSGLWYSILF